MINVSKEWDALHTETLLPKQSLELSWTITDPLIINKIFVTGEKPYFHCIEDIGKLADVELATYNNYARAEQYGWLLDGSVSFATRNESYGYVSDDYSDDSGNFTTHPKVHCKCDELYDGVWGVSIRWSVAMNEYPLIFTVTINDEVKTFNNNADAVTYIWFDEPTVVKTVDIEVSKWCLPGHRCRIEHVAFGIQEVFTDNDIMNFSCSKENNIINSISPQNTISFTLVNQDNYFDAFKETGIAQYISYHQPIHVRYGQKLSNSKIEYISGGVYYLTEYNVPINSNTVRFTAKDAFDYFTDEYTGLNGSSLDTTFYDIVNSLCKSLKLPLGYKIEGSLADKSEGTQAKLQDCTNIEVLQYVLQATNSIAYTDEHGMLIIKDAPDLTVPVYHLSAFEEYAYPEVESIQTVDNIVVKVYNYITESDTITLYDADVDTTDATSYPYILRISYGDSLVTSNITAEDTRQHVDLQIKTYLNYFDVYLYDYRKYHIVVKANKANVNNSSVTVGNTGVKVTVDNEIITSEYTANKVGQFVYDYVSHPYILSISNYRANVKVDCGDVITVDCNDRPRRIIITELTYSYNGAYKGTLKGRVVE